MIFVARSSASLLFFSGESTINSSPPNRATPMPWIGPWWRPPSCKAGSLGPPPAPARPRLMGRGWCWRLSVSIVRRTRPRGWCLPTQPGALRSIDCDRGFGAVAWSLAGCRATITGRRRSGCVSSRAVAPHGCGPLLTGPHRFSGRRQCPSMGSVADEDQSGVDPLGVSLNSNGCLSW